MAQSQLKPGDALERTREIDRWRPIYYAAASGDFNPIHIDQEFGQMAGLGGLILQGLCTMSMACETAVELLGNDPARLKKVKVRFSKPVKPGDEIKFTARVTEAAGNTVRGELVAVNQSGEEVLKNATFEGAEE